MFYWEYCKVNIIEKKKGRNKKGNWSKADDDDGDDVNNLTRVQFSSPCILHPSPAWYSLSAFFSNKKPQTHDLRLHHLRFLRYFFHHHPIPIPIPLPNVSLITGGSVEKGGERERKKERRKGGRKEEREGVGGEGEEEVWFLMPTWTNLSGFSYCIVLVRVFARSDSA